jgi:phosphoribosylaminoimidazole-succinocarboxamide synthase
MWRTTEGEGEGEGEGDASPQTPPLHFFASSRFNFFVTFSLRHTTFIASRMDLLTLELPEFRKIASGKVREIFDLGEHLLFVATDRISAFDCILPNAIPHKGEVLTQLSAFWFEKLDFVENHVVTTHFADFPEPLRRYESELNGRCMIVRKAKPLPIECVVRGYLIGSGWKDYQSTGAVCGIPLPSGLRQADRLPETIFTPATKAASGHDENIAWDHCVKLVGEDVARRVRDLAIQIYEEGRAWAAGRGIIVADTKFEFGLLDSRVILIDECLTPDSSRFWPASDYRPGISPPSFDKQFVRDYLETLDWPKTPPAPQLPESIIRKTSEKYLEAYERLTDQRLL